MFQVGIGGAVLGLVIIMSPLTFKDFGPGLVCRFAVKFLTLFPGVVGLVTVINSGVIG